MSPLRICVVGAGEWSGRMHQPVLRRLAAAGQIVCAAVCDLNRAAAEEYAAAAGAERVYIDAAAMLDECRPDGVVILVQPEAAPAVVAQAAARRVPFLVEKPPATDAAAHARLIQTVGDLTHLVGYNRRHAPYVVQAREWLAGHTIQSVTALFSRHRRHDADFSTTAVHAIDTARHLAGSDFAELCLEVAPCGAVRNYFLGGWTVGGTRIDVQIMPDTASAQEHYVVRSADRTVIVAFPQRPMIDLPGYVELHEGNRVASRRSAGEFALADDDLPALGGILGEHELLCRAIRGQASVESTLAATLQTQQLRDEMVRLAALPGRQVGRLVFSNPISRQP